MTIFDHTKPVDIEDEMDVVWSALDFHSFRLNVKLEGGCLPQHVRPYPQQLMHWLNTTQTEAPHTLRVAYEEELESKGRMCVHCYDRYHGYI